MVPLISRDRRQDQRAVVGKKPEAEVRKGQVARKSALGREPSCCLQDLPVGAFGHAVSAAGDSVAPAGGGLGDSASNRPDAPGATCADCLNTPAGISDRKRSSAGDNRGGVAAGSRADCEPVAEDGNEQAERLADSNDNGGHSSGGSRSEWNHFILPACIVEPTNTYV